MSVLMALSVALKALACNKMRTSLTMLGMIIGVAAVITMVALGQGAQHEIEAQIQSAGTNMIRVTAGNFRRGGISMGMGQSPRLKAEDVEAVREQVPDARHLAAGIQTREQVVAAGQNWNTTIQGTDVEFPRIRFWDLQLGSFFTTAHVQSAARVAVLGSVVRDHLFGEGSDPVGARIRIRNQSFQVLGVMAPKGAGQYGEDQDDAIFVPYTTVNKKLRGRDGTNISEIAISVASADRINAVADQITEVLRAEHALGPGEDDDFMVRTQEDMTSMRTREIGLRMAVGAKGRDVLLQFLAEAMALSLVGGLVGVGLGVGLSEGLTRLLAWPTSVPADAVVVAVGFAAATGVFFGFYPARKAAQLDPIESLRFE